MRNTLFCRNLSSTFHLFCWVLFMAKCWDYRHEPLRRSYLFYFKHFIFCLVTINNAILHILMDESWHTNREASLDCISKSRITVSEGINILNLTRECLTSFQDLQQQYTTICFILHSHQHLVLSELAFCLFILFVCCHIGKGIITPYCGFNLHFSFLRWSLTPGWSARTWVLDYCNLHLLVQVILSQSPK